MMRKIFFRAAVPLLILVVITLVVLEVVLSSKLDKGLIVDLIEAEKNMRVDVGEVKARLIGGRVELTDVLLSARDEHADAGAPVTERPAPADSQTRIRIRKASVKVGILDLLSSKLSIDSLIIDGLDVSYSIEPNGDPSLDPLFDPPKLIKGALNPEYEEKKRRRELAKARRKLKAGEEDPLEDTFNVSEMPMATTLQSLLVRDGLIAIELRKSKNRISFSDVQGTVSDLDVDPDNLIEHNSAHLELSGQLNVTGPAGALKFARLGLAADGDIQPFDSETGFLNPDLVTDVTIKKDSRIMSLPIAQKLASTLDQLERAGLDVSALEDILVVDRDSTLRLGLRNNVLRSVEALPVVLNGHRLVIDQGAWLNTANDEHLINASITLSEKLSNSTLGRANSALSDLVGDGVAGAVAELLFTPVTKGGRIHIPFVSSGDFNRPKVRLSVALKNIADAVKEGIKKDPLSLLKGLFDR